MTPTEEVNYLNMVNKMLQASREQLVELNTHLKADNARLRTLISDAVFHHAEEGRCLWCMRMERRGHSEKCPTFTPEGEVK